MDREPGDPHEAEQSNQFETFQPARFPANLYLPPADERLAIDAAAAMRQEYRDCSQWKKLQCHKVSVFAERDRGTVCVVHVGNSVEFDWTWEGALAFRPTSLDDKELFANFSYQEATFEEAMVWKGEVLEVDQRNGCLFISLENPERLPNVGPFFVRPFEFLSVLNSVFNEEAFAELRSDLPARLAATEGGIHPAIASPSPSSLSQLSQWWQHAWSVLWGPPGTGKTWMTGQQIAAALADPTERILVVSTTNRATDAVAHSIGHAARSAGLTELDEGRLLRIGKGASIRTFAAAGLESMLLGTESEMLREIEDLADQLRLFDSWEEKALTRKKITQLRASGGDQSKRNFVDPHVRVVVATAFKATCQLKDKLVLNMLEDGHAPFTTVFIDEAGLLSRTAIAALSFLAARRVVLVGDSKQLAPISRISRILPTRQQNWLASSGLSHLDDLQDTPPAVHVLNEQRRMHPQVCEVVSEFQYSGLLKTSTDTRARKSTLAPTLADYSRAIWYVLDSEGSELSTIRAERGTGNKSWVRSITPGVLQKLFADEQLRQSRGLFIAPFLAQAQMIASQLSAWGLTNWEASTVHSQQGSEADIVIFDTVNAGSYSWPFDEWKRLVNVALSRAREAVIVLASRHEMDEPYLRPLLRSLTPSRLVKNGVRWQWEKITEPSGLPSERTAKIAEPKTTYDRQRKTTSVMGEQINRRKRMLPVLSEEQQRLANLSLDGKPRLVRGVAGSGKSFVLCNWLAKTVERQRSDKNFRIWAVYANRSLHKLLQDSVEAAWASLTQGDLFDKCGFPWERVSLMHVRDVLAGILPNASLSMNDFEFDYDRAAEEFLNRQDATELLPRCTALFIDEAQDMGPSTLKLLLSVVEQSDAADPNSRSAHIFYDNAQNIYGRKTPKWSEFGLDLRGRSTIMRESFRATRPIAELALNILHRLKPDDPHQELQELLDLELVEKSAIAGEDWIHVRFNEIHGPKPIYKCFHNRSDELRVFSAHLKHLIHQDGIAPCDICVIYNGKVARQLLETQLSPMLAELGVELSVQVNRPFERRENTLVVTTANSYKGYESEVVMIPCVDQFVSGEGKILAHNLYVAMTRARSLLTVYGIHDSGPASRELVQTIGKCLVQLNASIV